MAARYWTVDEANERLEAVGALVEQAQRLVGEIRGAEDPAFSSNGHGRRTAEVARAALDELVGELDGEGIVLRDVDRGLIDFTAHTDDGREYWLCWLLGEPEVAWWHWPSDGFAGRTSIEHLP